MYDADVIVVGAGPAGVAAAIEVAKNNKKVVLVDRSNYPGSKNMYGGAVYASALNEVFEDALETLPYERIINKQTWSFLTQDTSFDLTYSNQNSKKAFAIKRTNLEKWMIETAKAKGVYYIPNTLVKNLILEKENVVGIETEQEKYYAPITIIADGVNSLLAKQLGLREDFKPEDMILSVKEVFKLDKKIIDFRFNLKEDLSNGIGKMLFGGSQHSKNLFMMSYFYTFKDTVSLGVGVNLADLKKQGININEIMDEIKQHPDIAPLIKDGQSIEYAAHMIPETGYKKMPKLTTNGAIIAGDAAGFINSVHSEGTNFALISGKIAGSVACLALEDNDFSEGKLNIYRNKLERTFVMQDLYSYRNIISRLHKRTSSIEKFYPDKIKEIFEIITSANGVSKAQQIRKFTFNVIFGRNIFELIKDFNMAFKCFLDVFFGK